jgi:hypothetical protein
MAKLVRREASSHAGLERESAKLGSARPSMTTAGRMSVR